MAIIRTTYSSLFDMMTRQGSRLKSEIRKWEEQSMTGLKVNRPSDAAGKMSQINRLRETANDQQIYEDNAVYSQTWLGSMDQVLKESEDVMVRAREIAIQMSSGTYNATDMAAAAVEVQGLQEELLQHANANVGGRYLFSGMAYDTEPFTDILGTYAGSVALPSTEIGDGLFVDTALVGSGTFGDAFTGLDDLVTALTAGSTALVQTSITSLDVGRDAIVRDWETTGFSYKQADDAITAAQGMAGFLTESMNGFLSANPEEAYTRLLETRTAYEAALQVASSGFDVNLFKYI